LLIADLGLASTAQPGLVLATRLSPQQGFWMTGGAALPVTELPLERRKELKKNLLEAIVVDRDGYFDPALVIRECLNRGCSTRVGFNDGPRILTGQPEYNDARRNLTGQPEYIRDGRAIKVSRNAPCPCGSGKKFKQCCMKRA
jgi:hypothetical protein